MRCAIYIPYPRCGLCAAEPVGRDISAITNALLEIQRLTYEQAASIIEGASNPADRLRELASEVKAAKL